MSLAPIICNIIKFVAPSSQVEKLICEYKCDSSSSSSESSSSSSSSSSESSSSSGL